MSGTDWFQNLAHARQEELAGWLRTAAILWTMERYGEWWKTMGYESRTEALAQPEIQLMPSTAAQYVAVFDTFRHVPQEILERSRPRFLYQAVAKVGADKELAERAAIDAHSLSWSAFLKEWKV